MRSPRARTSRRGGRRTQGRPARARGTPLRQSGPDASLPRRTTWRMQLLEERHGLPVEIVVVLLRPEANLKVINGLYRRWLPTTGEPYLQFRYRLGPRLGAAGRPITAGRPGHVAVGPHQCGELERLAGCHRPNGATVEGGSRSRKDGGIFGRRQRCFWVCLRGRVCRTITSLSACHERIDDLPGHSRRRTTRGRQVGLQEGRPVEARRLWFRLGADHFGTGPSPEHQAILEAITDPEPLEELVP